MSTFMSLLPEAGQTYVFDWISLVFFLLFLVVVIISIRKGFIRSALSFFALLIAFFVAYLLAKPLANWIYGASGWGDSLASSFSDFFIKIGSEHPVSTGNEAADAFVIAHFGSDNAMEWILSKSDLTAEIPTTGKTVLDFALASVSLPSFLCGYARDFILSAVPESASMNLAFYLGQSASSLLMVAICFAVLFLVTWILTLVIALLIGKALSHCSVLRWLDRLLGAVFGVFIGFIVLSLLSAALVALSSIPEVYSFLDSTLKLSDPNAYTIGKVFYNYNFLEILLGYFSSWIPSASSVSSSVEASLSLL